MSEKQAESGYTEEELNRLITAMSNVRTLEVNSAQKAKLQ